MTTFEEQLLQDAEDDRRCVEFIRNQLPSETKERLTDEQLYYFHDLLGEYLLDLIDAAPEAEDGIDIDVEEAAQHLARQAKKDGQGDFLPEDLLWVVNGELDYGEQEA